MTWKEIHRHLSENKFLVYSPGQHKGECTEPYIVLRDNGVMRRQSLEVAEYEVLLYYPIDHYSEFSGYIGQVKEAMNKLYPALKLTDDEQPHYPDEDVRAYMTSLIYRNTRISKVNRITRKDGR